MSVIDQAKAAMAANKPKAAAALLSAHLAKAPTDALAWRHLARAERAAGRATEAIAAYRQAATLNPADPMIQNGLGTTLGWAGDDEGAKAALERAIALKPDWADPWHNLFLLHERKGRWPDAARALAKATTLEVTPERLDKLLDAANHLDAERDAVALYEAMLAFTAHRPENATGWLRFGNGLVGTNRNTAAIDAYKRAIAIDATMPQAWYGLGLALQNKHQVVECEGPYRKAIELKPAFPQAYNNLGRALKHQARLAEARAMFEGALAIQPDKANSWNNLVFAHQYDPNVSMEALKDVHVRWGQRWCPNPPPRTIDDPNPDRPLRIGFVGADFGRHPVAYFLLGFLPHLDRTKYPFHVYNGRLPEDQDEFTTRIRDLSAGWTEAHAIGDRALEKRIRADKIDVLFDLAGHTRGNRLLVFAKRVAPVQVTWAGYVGTTGLPTMDWLLSDPRQSPEGAERWATERIWRMPDDYVCWEPPGYAPDVLDLPMTRVGHPTFGCFNNLTKVVPEVLALWARVVNAVPHARLVLKTKQLADPSLRKRIIDTLTQHGVDPKRVTCEGRSPHRDLLDRYNDIDVALDPFPYSGGLTTLEATWMGVPVVTLGGERFCARHTLAHLGAVGFTESTARDADDYVRIAAGLVGDPARLATIRRELRPRMAASPLCDGPRYARNWEAAVRGMWKDAVGR